MISPEDAWFTYEYPNYFKILPQINGWENDPNRIKNGKKVPEGFVIQSDKNDKWMSDAELRSWLDVYCKKFGNFE